MTFPEEYFTEKVVVKKLSTWISGYGAIAGWVKNVPVRWEDYIIEVPDMNNDNTMCVAKVTMTETVEATPDTDRYFIYRNNQKYRVVQHRVYPDIDGNELYRELLVAYTTF